MATMEFDDGQSSWYGDFDWLPEESHGFPAATTHEVPDAPSRNETIREPLNTDPEHRRMITIKILILVL